MSTDRDTRRIVRSWLRTDEGESADRVLDIVLDRLDTTPQRRATWWPARRTSTMNQAMRIALASAAVVAVALIGVSFFSGGNVGGPEPGGPSPTATPEPAALVTGPLEAGTYSTTPFTLPGGPISFTLTVPNGWEADVPGAVFPAGGPGGPDGAAGTFLQPEGLYSDPCDGNSGAPDVEIGPSVDDLVTALGSQRAYESTTASDVIVDGYSGKRLDLQLPSDVDFATCDSGEFWVWDAGPYAQGVGNHWQVTIVDVDGTRVVILAHDFADTPASTKAELQNVVASIQIDEP